jgi:hypothetical protein
MRHGRPRSVTVTGRGPQPVNLPPVIDPRPAPFSPLPVLNVPGRSDLVQLRDVPSVVSVSLACDLSLCRYSSCLLVAGSLLR